MTSTQKLTTLIQKLSLSQSNKLIAINQNSIVKFITDSNQSQLVSLLNQVLFHTQSHNFKHILSALLTDPSFTQKNNSQIITFFASNFTLCQRGFSSLTHAKKLVFIQTLLNYKIPGSKPNTIVSMLIQNKCRTDLHFSFVFLWNINQFLLSNLNTQKLSLNFSQLHQLSIRVIKNWKKLPLHLVDQSFTFINITLIPQLFNQNQQIKQTQPIITSLIKYGLNIQQSISQPLGSIYQFMAHYLHYSYLISHKIQSQLIQEILQISCIKIAKLFPVCQSLALNALETQIQKIEQYFNNEYDQNKSQQMKEQSVSECDQNLGIKKMLELNKRIKLLQGLSQLISNLLILLSQQKEGNNIKVVNDQINGLKRVFEMLSYCKDERMFKNLIRVYTQRGRIKQALGIDFNFDKEQLVKQIVRNCPLPLSNLDVQNLHYSYGVQDRHYSYEQSQLQQVMNHLGLIIKQLINQGKLPQILQLIKKQIQKQYDQTFNSSQFQSACNTLVLVFRTVFNNNTINQSQSLMTSQPNQTTTVTDSNTAKQLITKNDIIEWIKSLLNLNQSCLPAYRKLIVSKTYQILAQVFHIILPQNQYLQQVIENQLILNSLPQKKHQLQKLIQFYSSQGNSIFQQGFINKLQFKRFSQTLNSFSNHQHSIIENQQTQNINRSNSNLSQNLSSQMTHAKFRKYKLLDRIFKKMEQKSLTIHDKVYLWTIVIRLCQMGGTQSQKLEIKDILKLFSQKPDILFARHLAALKASSQSIQKQLQLPKTLYQSTINHFKEFPFFYQDQLKIHQQLNKI